MHTFHPVSPSFSTFHLSNSVDFSRHQYTSPFQLNRHQSTSIDINRLQYTSLFHFNDKHTKIDKLIDCNWIQVLEFKFEFKLNLNRRISHLTISPSYHLTKMSMCFSKMADFHDFMNLGSSPWLWEHIFMQIGAQQRKSKYYMVRSTLLPPSILGGPSGEISRFDETHEISKFRCHLKECFLWCFLLILFGYF